MPVTRVACRTISVCIKHMKNGEAEVRPFFVRCEEMQILHIPPGSAGLSTRSAVKPL